MRLLSTEIVAAAVERVSSRYSSSLISIKHLIVDLIEAVAAVAIIIAVVMSAVIVKAHVMSAVVAI